jgi:Leucine-rich repeat (LRR) protein
MILKTYEMTKDQIVEYFSQTTQLPDTLEVWGSLDLYNTQITELPENLTVDGDLDISHSQITKLPKTVNYPALKCKGFLLHRHI